MKSKCKSCIHITQTEVFYSEFGHVGLRSLCQGVRWCLPYNPSVCECDRCHRLPDSVYRWHRHRQHQMVFPPPEVLRWMDAEAGMCRTMHRICDLMVGCQSHRFDNHADHTLVLPEHRNPKNCSGNSVWHLFRTGYLDRHWELTVG
jgi:hypothetical protein